MKKKLLLVLLMVALTVTLFAISVSAAELSAYCDAKITLTSGETVTAYFRIGSWDGRPSVERDTIYKTTDTTGGTYSWADVTVLDMSNCTYTEGYAPEFMHGTNCNSIAQNVTTVYFPQTLKAILNTSFTSGWKSLETAYIPKSVERIHYNAFRGSPIKNVVIEEGSNLKSIDSEAFRECRKLESINLPNGLETIGYCAFYVTNLGGTVVIPNSVTSIGDGAFRNTKIEELYLGDGAISLGYNLVGEGGYNYLKRIYISAEAIFDEKYSEIWFETKGITVEICVVASEGQDVSEFVTNLKKTGRFKMATEDEIANGTAVSGYNAIIKLGYNRCDVFYSGEHLDNTSPCVINCTRCNSVNVPKKNPIHSESVSVSYKNYAENGTKITTCSNEGCQHNVEEALPALFKCLGYSASESGKVGFLVGFTVNTSAIEQYTQLTGKTVKAGVFAVLKDNLGENDIFDENGKASNGVITAEISSSEAVFQIKVYGFKDNQKDIMIAIGAYVEITDGTSTEYSYMQADSPKENEKYSFASYNSIVE